MLSKVFLPFGIERWIAAVAETEIHLDFFISFAFAQKLVMSRAIGADELLPFDAVRVLPFRCFIGQQATQSISSCRVVRSAPVLLDGLPEVIHFLMMILTQVFSPQELPMRLAQSASSCWTKDVIRRYGRDWEKIMRLLNSGGRRVSKSEAWGTEHFAVVPIGCEFGHAVLDGAMGATANQTEA